VIAGVDGRRDASCCAAHDDVVDANFQARQLDRRWNDHGQVRQPGFDDRQSFPGKSDSVRTAITTGERDGSGVFEPRCGKFVLVLVTRRQVEERPGRGVEPVALGKLGARLGHPAHRHELAALAVQHFGQSALGPGFLGLGEPGHQGDLQTE